MQRFQQLKSVLSHPVNGASLAFFRIAVGLVMGLEAFSLLRPSASTSGRVMLDTYYTGADVTFHLPYAWFEWLPVLPHKGMYAVVIVLGIAAVMMAAGFLYRISTALVFLAWGYLYAIESTRTYWMSYYYLELLITFLLIWMPAANRYSIDAVLSKGKRPAIVPYWTVLLLRVQLVITYFYAGVAKLNSDWLFDAVPMRDFLAKSSFLARPGMEALRSDGVAFFLSWTGAIFDLSVGFLLLYRRTRILGMILLVLFHSTNHFFLFDDIIWFPLLGILTATIFLEPSWPERFFKRAPKNPQSKGKQKQQEPVFPGAQLLPSHAAVFPFVIAWLTLQTLLPIRHYLIPGDGRFTWEGLSFSWRLKAEIYRSVPCEIFIEDRSIISRDANGSVHVNWGEWRGEKIIYRTVKPGVINWSGLPEILVLFEPEIGERIIYNPLSGNQARPEAEAIARANAIWQEAFGRVPEAVRRTVAVSEITDAFATAVRSQGGALSGDSRQNLALFLKSYGAQGSGKALPLLRRTHPFALGQEAPISAPFFVVEDPVLFEVGPAKVPILNRSTWKFPLAAKSERYVESQGQSISIHIIAPTVESRGIYPAVCIMDSIESPEALPGISWDILRDSSVSKAMHISTNPFLLRRYARRVAALWHREYGHRPAIHAKSAVSLNGRPPQPLVDEHADLASVPVTHFRHNSWVHDLQLPRIPRGN